MVAVMLREHAAGRQAIAAVAANLAAAADDEQARAALADGLAQYAQLLRMHIDKEDDVLFPLAEHLADEQVRRRPATEFARVQDERVGKTRAEYRQLAAELAGARS
jgi:hemerythrin-like domain-containing protein